MPEPQLNRPNNRPRQEKPQLPPAPNQDLEAIKSWLSDFEQISVRLRKGEPIAESVALIKGNFEKKNPEHAKNKALEEWIIKDLSNNAGTISKEKVGPIEHDWFAKVATLSVLNPEFVHSENLKQNGQHLSLQELALRKLEAIISNQDVSQEALAALNIRGLQQRYRLFDWARGLVVTLCPELGRGNEKMPLYEKIKEKRNKVITEVISRPEKEVLRYVDLHLKESKPEAKEGLNKMLLNYYKDVHNLEMSEFPDLRAALICLKQLDLAVSEKTNRLTLNLFDENHDREIPVEIELSFADSPLLTFRHQKNTTEKKPIQDKATAGKTIVTLEAKTIANPLILKLSTDDNSREHGESPLARLPLRPAKSRAGKLPNHERVEQFLLEKIKREAPSDSLQDDFRLANYDIPKEGTTIHLIVSPVYSGDLSPLDNFGGILLNTALAKQRKMRMSFIYSDNPEEAMKISVRRSKEKHPDIKHILRSIYAHGNAKDGLAFDKMLNQESFLGLLGADEGTPSTNRTIACYAGGLTESLVENLNDKHADKRRTAAFFFETSTVMPNYVSILRDGGSTLSAQELLLIKYLYEDKTLSFGEAFMNVNRNSEQYRRVDPQAIIDGEQLAEQPEAGPSKVK